MKKLPDYEYGPNFDASIIQRNVEDLGGQKHIDFLNNNTQIGPHEGRYLELILMGKKAFCLEAPERVYQALKEYINNQELIAIPNVNENNEVVSYNICRADYSSYIEIAKEAISNIKKASDSKNILKELENHKILGEVLGYPKKDIDYYCLRRQAKHIEEQKRHLTQTENKSLIGRIKNKLAN